MTKISSHTLRTGKSAFFSCLLLASVAFAQKPAAKQPDDPDYTAKIKEYLTDPRFSTELVDHLPASAKVPTPLRFLGSMPGQPGELYYNADINRYYAELAKDSPSRQVLGASAQKRGGQGHGRSCDRQRRINQEP